MQAFLITGNNIKKITQRTNEFAKEFHAKILEYPLTTIDDVRSLNKLIRLTLTEPTLIVINNIHETGIEALNAFLKNLEEPQENLYFVLTAPTIRKVLSTVVSRCQIIKVQREKYEVQNDEIEKFLIMNTEQKIAFSDKIKERNKAIEFIESLIFFLHEKKDFTNMELLLKTLTCLKANGNVNLQLSNLVINFE